MPTYEHSGVFSYKDENKNVHLLYPVTKKDNVEGMDQVEQDISTAQTTADNALTVANQVKQTIEDGGGVGGGACVLKITFATGFKGQTFTVTGGGETKTGTVPDGLVANVNVQNCNTEYTVACSTAGGDAYSTTVTTGAYFGQYTAQLDTFTAILTVTTKAGAVVSVQKGSNPAQTATANGSGKATFTLTSAGSYTVKATYDGVTSDTKTVTANTNGGSLTATLTFITLTVTAEAGSNLTLTNGSTTKTGTTAGASTFYLPNTGNWVVTATKSGQTATATVNVNSYGAFSVTLAYYKYVGVKVVASNDNSETAVTYTEDAVGMSAGYASWKDHPIFSKIKPCVVKNGVVQYYLNRDNMTKKEDGSAATLTDPNTGDVMIEIPKLGYKMTTANGEHFINVTDDPNAAGYCYRAHSLDSEGDCDKIYIGAYLGSISGSALCSVSGQAPKTDISLTTARNYAQARGTGYQLVSFYPLTLLQCLYLIMYKNRNGQTALGKGYTGASAKVNTGGTNSKAFCSGDTSSATTQMKFLGIEDFWGNLFWWIDGIYCDSSRNIKTAFKNFADDGSSYPYTKASGLSSNLGDWMKDIQGTNEGGFTIKTGGGSATQHWADSAILSAGYCADFGGDWNNGDYAGPFRFCVNCAASDSGSYLGARLMYKHKAA